MATKTENTAAGIATYDWLEDKYAPENLMLYRTSLALIENMVHGGILSKADYRKSCKILSRKYGLPSDSIFAESA